MLLIRDALCPPQEMNPDPSLTQPTAQSLYQLSYPGSTQSICT